MAPEVEGGYPSDVGLSDVYSAGVSLLSVFRYFLPESVRVFVQELGGDDAFPDREINFVRSELR